MLSSVVGVPHRKRQQQQQQQHLGVTTYMFFSHIRTLYFSEGSVQHPPPYSFRKIVRKK